MPIILSLMIKVRQCPLLCTSNCNVELPAGRQLTQCRPDGLLIKYPQFLDVVKTLNVQPHIIFLLTV